MKKIPLRCPTCGPFLLYVDEAFVVEPGPQVYRFCPICGNRHLFWDQEVEKADRAAEAANATECPVCGR